MYKLSPSDFAFLYEECKLCYYLKVKEGIYQPSMPMPGVFSAINSHIQGTLVGKNLKTLSKDLPEGEVIAQEGWVESQVIPDTKVYIKGKYDLLVKNEKEELILVDLKISTPDIGKIEKYKTQLGAYKYAFEKPNRGISKKIKKMGLLIFYPESVTFTDSEALLHFPPKWFEVPSDEKGFVKFMKEIDRLLAGEMPNEGENCKWCKYRHIGEKLAHGKIEKEDKQEDLPF